MRKLLSFRPGTVALGATLFLMICCAFNACKKDDNKPPKKSYALDATLSGSQEVPANNSTATGTLSGTYNSKNRIITFKLIWSDLTGNAAAMHFHGPAVAGQNAGVAVGITGFPTTASGMVSGSDTLTEAQGADLLAGKWYANVHTANFPGGEIRGQVSATAPY